MNLTLRVAQRSGELRPRDKPTVETHASTVPTADTELLKLEERSLTLKLAIDPGGGHPKSLGICDLSSAACQHFHVDKSRVGGYRGAGRGKGLKTHDLPE